FLTRELRTHPPRTGDIAYCETAHDPDLARESAERLRRIGFRGVVKVDYKWDAQARQYRMLEIEPHYQTWHLLGAQAGVNLPALAYRHQRGELAPVSSTYADGARLLYFSNDWKAYWRGYRKTGTLSLGAYLSSLLRRNRYRILDPADPVPFVHSVVRYAVRRGARLVAARKSPATSREASSTTGDRSRRPAWRSGRFLT